MKTQQPSYWCVNNIGDAEPLEHDGGFVLVDRTGVYCPVLVLLQRFLLNDSDQNRFDEGDETVVTHQLVSIELEPLTTIKDDNGRYIGVSDNKYHVDVAAWFGGQDSIFNVSKYAGHRTPESFMLSLISSCPTERAYAYLNLVRYYGSDEFSAEPNKIQYKKAKLFVDRMYAQMEEAKGWHQGYF